MRGIEIGGVPLENLLSSQLEEIMREATRILQDRASVEEKLMLQTFGGDYVAWCARHVRKTPHENGLCLECLRL